LKRPGIIPGDQVQEKIEHKGFAIVCLHRIFQKTQMVYRSKKNTNNAAIITAALVIPSIAVEPILNDFFHIGMIFFISGGTEPWRYVGACVR
jgi:hypothetical protein